MLLRPNIHHTSRAPTTPVIERGETASIASLVASTRRRNAADPWLSAITGWGSGIATSLDGRPVPRTPQSPAGTQPRTRESQTDPAPVPVCAVPNFEPRLFERFVCTWQNAQATLSTYLDCSSRIAEIMGRISDRTVIVLFCIVFGSGRLGFVLNHTFPMVTRGSANSISVRQRLLLAQANIALTYQTTCPFRKSTPLRVTAIFA